MTGISNVAIIDGVGNLKTAIVATDANNNIAPAHTLVDMNGNSVGTNASPLFIKGTSVGSTGKDFSIGVPSLPNIGSIFGNSGIYANYILNTTVPANTSYLNIDIENVSGNNIVIIRDDGTANSGSAPLNASIFSLAAGSANGAQGGSWSSTTFKGRLQIYAPVSNSFITIMVD